MQYVRSISGSVSKTWNSINPATLSGAIDVIVVEHEDGTLACSPFHVRFGKFSLLRPSEKKVEFKVNGVAQNYAMKLGDGGEAFFVFETSSQVPEALQTSPLVSPATSPVARPITPSSDASFRDPDFLDLDDANVKKAGVAIPKPAPIPLQTRERSQSDYGNGTLSSSNPEPGSSFQSRFDRAIEGPHNLTASDLTAANRSLTSSQRPVLSQHNSLPSSSVRSHSPPPLSQQEAYTRAITLSKKLWNSNIPSQVNDQGDLMLDITGYKSSEEESLRAEVVARQILSEEFDGETDIGSLIGVDEKGNLWIYSSEEAKEAALSKVSFGMVAAALTSTDALSDPGYQSDDTQSQKSDDYPASGDRRQSDGGVGLTTPPDSPNAVGAEPSRSYAKTLRLTSDQLKSLDLKPGGNPMSFSVNRATCQAYMYLWKWDIPIVISDIDGTITKSDALGHVLNMIGRDWTHLGVAKLYTDIVANGYNIFYLTSRSVGQADTTRAYIAGIVQDGYKLPKGPVIMSPDRTIAALRREIYLRKPEVFKMACLRDIMSLFNTRKSPFYAGFGNRLTDALSYRSVNIPSTRIFTINSNAEVSLDLLSLNKYKTGYTSMRETVDHFFPPVGMLVQEGGEAFTDFNYWRDIPPDMDDFSGSDSGDEGRRPKGRRQSLRSLSEDEGSAGGDDEDALSDEMGDSYLSRDSTDRPTAGIIRQSIEVDDEDDDDDHDRRTHQARPDYSNDQNTVEQTLDALDLMSDAMPSQQSKRLRDGLQEPAHELD